MASKVVLVPFSIIIKEKEMKKYFCLERDLNPGPLDLVTITLPLSYGSTDGNHGAKTSIYV